METFYMLGSLVFGIIAWSLACMAIASKKRPLQYSVGSFALCAAALLFQVLETRYLAIIGNWSAIEDISHAVSLASCVLTSVTVGLNMIAVVRVKRKQV